MEKSYSGGGGTSSQVGTLSAARCANLTAVMMCVAALLSGCQGADRDGPPGYFTPPPTSHFVPGSVTRSASAP
jgi:hypothetical protein